MTVNVNLGELSLQLHDRAALDACLLPTFAQPSADHRRTDFRPTPCFLFGSHRGVVGRGKNAGKPDSERGREVTAYEAPARERVGRGPPVG